MKIAELLCERVLQEGTWALPDTPQKVITLLKLMAEPIKAVDKQKRKVLYGIVGSDDLFDALDDAHDKKAEDIRPVIIKHLPSFLDTRRWTRTLSLRSTSLRRSSVSVSSTGSALQTRR